MTNRYAALAALAMLAATPALATRHEFLDGDVLVTLFRSLANIVLVLPAAIAAVVVAVVFALREQRRRAWPAVVVGLASVVVSIASIRSPTSSIIATLAAVLVVLAVVVLATADRRAFLAWLVTAIVVATIGLMVASLN